MTYELTDNEKISVINQHLRTLSFSRYNYEISLLEENASVSPDAETINSLNGEIAALDVKINALKAEAAKLTPQE